MVKVFINNNEVLVPINSTVLEACTKIGIDVPRFCYHQKLNVAGNCRMCLVEIEKSPKPVASCTFPVINNLKVFTNSPLVKKARENILEFLLINHPLDCPICDQGGECDLQDQTWFFGSDSSRFFEYKRSVKDKNCGPLIKTIMTRCIHCTKCVRFLLGVAGFSEFGTTNRGQKTEIGTYINSVLKTELSGNIIDLCPVGALTSKPYAFLARPWELRSVETIDFSDALGSNLKMEFKELEIVRVLPRLNENINEHWLTDKARFNFDAYKIQRLGKSYLKNKTQKLIEVSWEKGLAEFYNVLLKKRNAKNLAIVCSVFLDLGTLNNIKNLTHLLAIKNIGFSRNFLVNLDFQENFTFATRLKNLEKAELFLFIGTNPRYEASMLNLKLKKRANLGLLKVALIGTPFDLSYKTSSLGITSKILLKIAEGKHPFCKNLRHSKMPLLILNASVSERSDFLGVEKLFHAIKNSLKKSIPSWNIFCFLNQEANQTGGFFLGLGNRKDSKKENQKFIFFNGLFKEKETLKFQNFEKSIFLASYGSELLLKTDLILPIETPLEKKGYYMNAEGVIQKSEKVFNLPSLVREHAKIISTINFNETLKKNTKPFLGFYKTSLSKIFNYSNIKISTESKLFGKSIVSQNPFRPFFTDFFNSDKFSKMSLTMAKCSKAYRNFFVNFRA